MPALQHISVHVSGIRCHELSSLLFSQDQIYSRNYGIDDVFMTCVILFRDQALSNGAIKRYLRMTLLGQIEQNRKGQSVDR